MCPQRGPRRPQQPIFGTFLRDGPHFERRTTSSSDLTATRLGELHDIIRPTRTRPPHFGTKLSTHTRSHRTSGTKLSTHTRNGPIRHVLPTQGEFCTALVSTTLSRENFVPNTRQKSNQPTQQHSKRDRRKGHPRNHRNPAAVPAGVRAARPRPNKFRMQFPHSTNQHKPKTAEYQRLDFNT